MNDRQTRKDRLAHFDRDTWWAWPFAFACAVLWATYIVYGF